MKRSARLGITNGDLLLALSGELIPTGAAQLGAREALFWLRLVVRPNTSSPMLHALSEVAEALGYCFHGATSFDDLEWVLATLESAIKDGRLVVCRVSSTEGGGKGPTPEPPSPKPPEPEPTPVNPLIEPLALVVVVQKSAKNPTSGATEPYTHPKRQPITLKTDAAFDGTATFTCDKPDKVKFFSAAKDGTEIKLDGTANVFKPRSAPPWAPAGASISSGVTVFVAGAAASGAMDDITVKLALSGGSRPVGPEDKATITSVEVTLEIHKSQPNAASAPAFSGDDKIHVGRNLLVQNAGGSFHRAKLVIKQIKPADFKGDVVLKPTTGNVDAFKDEKPKAGEASLLPFTVAADKIPGAGEVLFAQGKSASADLRDTGFTLGIKGVEDEGDKVVATAVELRLDIAKSRTAAQGAATPMTDPSPLSDDDKVKVGRFVHEQDTGNHHGRALLVVRKIKPEKFDGKIVLEALPAPRTELFPNERPTAGEVATAVPHEIDVKAKNEDAKFWVQGKTVSGALRDTGYLLHLKEDPKDNADKVLLTVCKLSDLEADLPRTPQRVSRYGNNPVARHPFKRSTGASADHFDEDPTKNLPFALVEDSVVATDPIKLEVKVAPAGTPVTWSALRDTRPGLGDHANIVAMGGPPTHRADGAAAADPLKRELLADGVGTFHVRAFVDCNGSGNFEQRVDFEPNLLMIMILIRAKGHTNTSVAQPANASASVRGGGGGPPTAATGVRVSTGNFANGTNDAVHQIGTINVTGGGQNGRLGLDMLFAGWMNNEIDTPGSLVNGEDVVATYQHTLPPLPNPAGGPPIPQPPAVRQRIGVRRSPASPTNVFLPGGAAAPAAWDAGPVLDTSLNVGAGTGGNTVVGTEGAVGPPVPIVKTNLAVGQRWTIEMWDSPGDSAPPGHGGFAPTRLTAYRFNIDFRSDLVVWTNSAKAAGATASNEPTHRLYSTVQTNTWNIRLALTFNAAGAAVAPVPAQATVTLTKDASATRKATPLDGQAAETRGPQLLSMLAVDARN